MTEWDVYEFFAEARRASTGRVLTNAVKSERPDILATCGKLGDVGIEITDARPEMADDDIDFLENWLDHEIFDYFAAADHIYIAIERKDAKRRSSGWQRPENTILLIRSFADVRPLLEHFKKMPRQEFLPKHGFKEIWVQDYELTFWKDGEVLGSAIICLHPPYWWRRRRILRYHRKFQFSVRTEY